MNYRAIWISDVHLGTKHSQVHKLIDFLRESECGQLYVVGDFIDGWQLRRKWFWADQYNVLIQKLLRKNRKKTRVTFITGNHDEFLEPFIGIPFGSVRLVERTLHVGFQPPPGSGWVSILRAHPGSQRVGQPDSAKSGFWLLVVCFLYQTQDQVGREIRHGL